MKKIFYLLVALVMLIFLVSCATVQPIEPNQDSDLTALKERASRSIEEHLSAEDKRLESIQWDNWLNAAGNLGRSKSPNFANNPNRTIRYRTQFMEAYRNAMQEFIEINHIEVIDEHNRRASELRQEREERNQRLRHEMKVLLANGVSGNANWLAFQQDFDPFRILTLISAQRNNSAANTVITQTANDMDRRYREIQPLSEEQSNWYQAMGTYILMEIGIAANFTSSLGQDAIQLARGKLEELNNIRTSAP